MAKRLIAYKQKISEEWLEKKNNESKNESDDETSEDPVVKKLTKNIKDQFKTFKLYFLIIYIMFDKIEYKLLFSSCITKDEYKQLKEIYG